MSPTALIVGAAAAPGTVALVRMLARKADYTIAADGGARICVDAGVRPDAVVGDLDSLDPDTARALQADGVEFRTFPRAKDSSDLDLAIAQVRTLGAKSIVVTAAFSGRLDHTLASVGSLASAADLAPRLVEPDQAGWILDVRSRGTLHVAADEPFSLIALVDGTSVGVEGAQWPLDRVTLPVLSSIGVSNVSSSSGAVVRAYSGTALVVVLSRPLER